MATPTPTLGARAVYLRGPERPAPSPAAFARAKLELVEVTLPNELEDAAAVELVRGLESACQVLILDVEPQRRAALEAGCRATLVDAAQAALILNTARALVALSGRGFEGETLSEARVAAGGPAAARVCDALISLGLDATRRVSVDSVREGAPAGVDIFLLPEADAQRASEAAEDDEEPGEEPDAEVAEQIGLVAYDSELVLPALARAAADAERSLDDEACAQAALALAGLARGGELPAPDDVRLLVALVPAIASAGWAGEGPDPLEAAGYADSLGQALCPLRRTLAAATERARKTSRKLVFLDAEEPEVLLAARQLLEAGLAEPVLLGDLFRLESRAKELGLTLRGMKLHNPRRDRLREAYAQALHESLGPTLGLDLVEAQRWVEDPAVFGALTVTRGEAHAMLCLVRRDRGLEPLERLLSVLPLRHEARGRPGLHLLAWGSAPPLVIADTTGARDATSEEMAEAAIQAASFVEEVLGEEPRVALVAEVSYGARRDPALERLERARDLARVRREGLLVDGPLAADVALDAELQSARYPACALGGRANVLVFPGRLAARSAVDLLRVTLGAKALGPVSWGLRHPLGLVERGATTDDIVHLGLVTTALAIQSDRGERKAEPSPLRAALDKAVAAFEESAEEARPPGSGPMPRLKPDGTPADSRTRTPAPAAKRPATGRTSDTKTSDPKPRPSSPALSFPSVIAPKPAPAPGGASASKPALAPSGGSAFAPKPGAAPPPGALGAKPALAPSSGASAPRPAGQPAPAKSAPQGSAPRPGGASAPRPAPRPQAGSPPARGAATPRPPSTREGPSPPSHPAPASRPSRPAPKPGDPKRG